MGQNKNKLMIIHKINILDLVISTEEELIVNLKITDKIGDYQAITLVTIKQQKEGSKMKKLSQNT